MLKLKNLFLIILLSITTACEPNREEEDIEFREQCPFWFRPKACGYDCPGLGAATSCVNITGSSWECSSCDASGACTEWKEKAKSCPLI